MDDESDEKIRVRCECGKAYRVARRKAGKKIPCKACGAKIRVPGEPVLSQSSRADVLLSVGIDPDASRRNFEDESSKAGKPAGKLWKCSRCAAPLESDELNGAYVEGELVCSVCRAGLEDRKAAREGEGRKRSEVAVAGPEDPRRARRLAVIHGVLLFVGFAGPLWAVCGLRLLVAALVGLVAAGLGAWLVASRRG